MEWWKYLIIAVIWSLMVVWVILVSMIIGKTIDESKERRE